MKEIFRHFSQIKTSANALILDWIAWFVSLLVVLGFNTITAKVISWRSLTHMCFLAFSHSTNTTFLSKATNYFSAEVRGKNTPERKVAATGDQLID